MSWILLWLSSLWLIVSINVDTHWDATIYSYLSPVFISTKCKQKTNIHGLKYVLYNNSWFVCFFVFFIFCPPDTWCPKFRGHLASKSVLDSYCVCCFNVSSCTKGLVCSLKIEWELPFSLRWSCPSMWRGDHANEEDNNEAHKKQKSIIGISKVIGLTKPAVWNTLKKQVWIGKLENVKQAGKPRNTSFVVEQKSHLQTYGCTASQDGFFREISDSSWLQRIFGTL